jgi:class 3 adenylate cyclase/tetratricopeptide (TPR) repeat protein
VPACAICGYKAAEDFKFCPECGEPAVPSGQEQRKVVTVLRCDVVGSTALGESFDPEALRSLLARYFEQMKGIIERHGGTVEKFIGDAVMAVFGVPLAHEDDALRACRAAVEMRDALPALGIEGRIGLMTGEVVTGTEERLATGDAVNVAARMEQAAEAGEVLIGKPTLELVREAVEVEPLEPLALKGKAQPVEAYRLLAVHEAAERRHQARFIGRERELAAIHEAWDRALAERRCELVTIVGEAGVGKSRLVAEALASLEARLVQGRCLPYGEGITYWPVIEILKQLAASPPDEAAAAAIRSVLGETDVATSAEEIAWAFRKMLEHAAADQSLIVVFDDIQWGEETFLDLIEHLALLSSEAPILILAMARPELTERRSDWPLTLRLEPLTAEEVEELIPERIPGELRAKIAHAAGGNPLFLEEMAAMAGEATGEVPVPPTLQALLATRLDQLDAAERRVLERGAVEGEVFHRGAVQALASEETQVTPRLAALVRKGLIRPQKSQLPGEDGFRFRHLLIRDAAYEGLPKSARAELHERFATWLEGRGSELVELDELVGYHLEKAYRFRSELGVLDARGRGLARRAGQLLAAAARRADARGDTPAAIVLLERAVALAPDGPNRAKVRLDLGRSLLETGDFARAEEVLYEAGESAAAHDDRALVARVLLERSHVRLIERRASIAEYLVETQRAITALEDAGDDEGLARAWWVVGEMRWLRCEFAAAEDAMTQSLAHAERAGAQHDLSRSRTYLALAAIDGPTPLEDALRRCRELLEHAAGDQVLKANIGYAMASAEAMRGRFAEAREFATRSTATYEELGRPFTLAAWSRWSGSVELLAGDLEAAERIFRSGYETLSSLGEKLNLSSIAVLLAEALYLQGRDQEAEHITRVSEEATSPEDVWAHVAWRSARAKILARRGKLDEAERLARQALELIGKTDALNMRAQTLLSLAEVLTAADRAEEAMERTRDAVRLYEVKGNVVMAERVRLHLAELQPSLAPAEPT